MAANMGSSSTFIADSNKKLEEIVADYPNAIIGDWHKAAEAAPETLQADQIHPDVEGSYLYAGVVKKSFAELSKRLRE